MPSATVLVLAVLYRRRGEPLTPMPFATLSATTPKGVVTYHMREIPQILKCEAVDLQARKGYRPTQIGMTECKAALEGTGREILEAA